MQSLIHQTIEHWHQYVATQNPAILDELLAEEVVFHSPVVWTPQRGKNITKLYLMGASHVLADGFEYQHEVREGNVAVLEFSCKIDEISVEGVDIIEINDEGKIIDFKVMIRPLKAIQIVHQKMGMLLPKK